jgi:outer membrane protein assembly factor BamB
MVVYATIGLGEEMNRRSVFGTFLALLLAGVLTVASNVQPATSQTPFGFDVEREPEHPTVRDEVNVIVIFLDVPSVSYTFRFGPLTRVNDEFSVDIDVSEPFILLPVYVGNVTQTYELGKLSEGLCNFSITVHYWQQLPDGTWLPWSFDYSYNESFTVLPAVDWWPMFHHDLDHTGYSTSTAPTTNDTLWNYTTSGGVYSSPAVADGMVYVGSFDDRIYCLNASTGTQIWDYTTGAVVESSPAVSAGMVYVGSDDYNVYCLNASTGGKIWNYTTGGFVRSCPAVSAGMVYVDSDDYHVYCLNASTGTPAWNYTTGSFLESSPAVVAGMVYVDSDDYNVYCLNASTGDKIWNYTTGGGISSPAVSAGMVYVGSNDRNVYCLNASTGDKIWNYTTGGGISSPAVSAGMVYVGSNDRTVYCLNASTGDKIWNYTTGDLVIPSPAVAYGMVYVGSEDYHLYCLNASTGTQVWNFTGMHAAGAWATSSPAVADGMVYAGLVDYNVYCLDAYNGTEIWGYTTGSYVDSSPAVAGGVVFVGSDDGNVYAFGAHDVAVTNVSSPKKVIGQSMTGNVTATVANLGSFPETVNVTLYANMTAFLNGAATSNETKIGSFTNVPVGVGNNVNLTFVWNTTGLAKGNYTISAYATPVPGETDTADNNCTDGWAIVSITGDVTGPNGVPDGQVNLMDVYKVAMQFGSSPPTWDPCWGPVCDINNDGAVNLKDYYKVCMCFGQTDP